MAVQAVPVPALYELYTDFISQVMLLKLVLSLRSGAGVQTAKNLANFPSENSEHTNLAAVQGSMSLMKRVVVKAAAKLAHCFVFQSCAVSLLANKGWSPPNENRSGGSILIFLPGAKLR